MAIARSRDISITEGWAGVVDGARRLISGLVRASSAQYRRNRLEEDLEIQPQRPVLDVVEIQLQPLGERELAPSGDLPQAGETRLHAEALALDALVEEIHVPQRHGARPDEAHLTGQHVEELRKLVEAAATQEAARSRDPRVVGDLEDGARGLAQVLELRLSPAGVFHHRPELHHPEAPLVEADPLLHEEDRAGRVALDGQGDEAEYREQQREHEGHDGDIREPLDQELPFFLRDRLEGEKGNWPKRDQPRARRIDI